MDDISTSWNVYDYPEPDEIEEKEELDWDTYNEEQWEQHRLEEEFEEEYNE